MKTSKIIFISLLGTIALIILAASIDIRITGKRNGDNVADLKRSKQILPAFKALNLSSCKNIQIVQNDSSFMEITYPQDSIVPKINYSIVKDTLTISGLNKKNRGFFIKICATDSLESIKLENSDLGIYKFGFNHMSFDLNHSGLHLVQENKDKSSVHTIQITAKNHSYIHFDKFKIDLLGVTLQNTNADIYTRVNKISGSLTDTSRIVLHQVGEISLKKDATSKMNIYN